VNKDEYIKLTLVVRDLHSAVIGCVTGHVTPRPSTRPNIKGTVGLTRSTPTVSDDTDTLAMSLGVVDALVQLLRFCSRYINQQRHHNLRLITELRCTVHIGALEQRANNELLSHVCHRTTK